MARHKTAHRKFMESYSKEQRKLRDQYVAELAESGTLKPNAEATAKRLARASKSK